MVRRCTPRDLVFLIHRRFLHVTDSVNGAVVINNLGLATAYEKAKKDRMHQIR